MSAVGTIRNIKLYFLSALSALGWGEYRSGAVTLNDGEQLPLQLDVKGALRVSAGAAADGAAIASAGNPTLIGGTDGANLRAVNVDSNGAVRLQSGGTPGQAAPNRVTQIGGPDAGGLLRASRISAGGLALSVAGVGTGYRSTALEASAVVSATPVTLVRFGMANNAAAARYCQVHDANALPANGAIPEDGASGQTQNTRTNVTCPPTNTLSVGCVLACSTTMASLTIDVASNALFVADLHPSTS